MQTKFLSTAIGSMPYGDPKHAVDVSIAKLDAPIWPQLGAFGLLEQMEIQYSEGVPCVVIDKEKNRMYFNTAGDTSEEMASFYETYTVAMDPDDGDGDCSALAISEEYAHGLHEMLRRVKASENKYPWLKVQTTGPCSVALTITDENKRAIYYNEEFRDIVVKAMAMKCRWQIQQFKPYAENIICFIDEPILSAFGSSTYISVQRDDVVAMLSEVIDAVHADGALAGIHCCGNTEWSILVDAGVDILNFDAFEYGHTVVMYADHIKKHLERGGMLAWGIVPTSAKVMEQTCETLEPILDQNLTDLAAKTGLSKEAIAKQSLITPSCGTGSLSVAEADKVFALVDEFSKYIKNKYGF